MRLKTVALIGTAICMLSGPALASDTGWFVGIGDGLSFPTNITVKSKSAATTLDSADFGFDPTWRGTLSVGYAFDFGFRLEAELGYTHPSFDNNANKMNFSNASFRVVQGAANLLYDVPLSRDWLLNFGVGAGYGSTAILRDNAVKHSSGALTGQLIAGVTYRLSNSTDVQLDYRYVAVQGVSYKNGFGTGIDENLGWARSHNLMLTFRLFLDDTPNSVARQEPSPPPVPSYNPPPLPVTPAPEPTPAPAPTPAPTPALAPASSPALAAPVKVFVVYFDFNQSQLDEPARTIVAAAVKTAKASGWVKLLVTGHTDTVGTEQYNLQLSRARARAVRVEMIRDGLDEASIAILGKGWSDPAVATGPGKPEPRNRRAVISPMDNN